MTDRRPSIALRRPSMTMTVVSDPEQGTDSFLRRTGRTLIVSMYGALRAIRLYPIENDAVQNALTDLASQAQELMRTQGELELRISGEFIFVNTIRLRLDLDNFASFTNLLAMFRATGIGYVAVAPETGAKDWLAFLTLVQGAGPDDPDDRFEFVREKLAEAGVASIVVGPPALSGEEDQERAKERAKRTYAQSVAVTKELISSIRMGGSPNLKKIKRVVQGIVDQILTEETSLIGLTTIRDYDEYTFTHSVNTCILSMALGRRLGLTKLQLYDLGLAALFHDIGKSRIPQEVLNKPESLTEHEWGLISAHPWLGLLTLFEVRGGLELPYRAMVVAFEHHMKRDLSGYPKPKRPRTIGMFSKIVAAADGFDAATSRRVYQTDPLTPADVLSDMRDNPRRGMDPVVVKAFINMTGIYPVGTLVVLDSLEVGVVHAVNPLQDMLSRPIVRIIADAQGNMIPAGDIVDLADHNEGGGFTRTIIKTEDPERYGVRVGDYFV